MYGKLMSFQREHFEKSHFYASMVDPFLKKAFTRKMNKTSKAGLYCRRHRKNYTGCYLMLKALFK